MNSIKNFPVHMTFFTTPELLEIGGLPFVSSYDKPTRNEALKYYRRVADTYQAEVAPLRDSLFRHRERWFLRNSNKDPRWGAADLLNPKSRAGNGLLRYSQLSWVFPERISRRSITITRNLIRIMEWM